jgi:hypothetical protein
VEDTCITATFTHFRPAGFPEEAINGPPCARFGGGGGGDGGGASTSTLPPPTTTTLPPTDTFLQDLLDQIRLSIPITFRPLFVQGTAPEAGRVSAQISAAPAPQARVAPGPLAAAADGTIVLAKGKRKIRRPGSVRLAIRPTKKGRRFLRQGLAFTAAIDVGYRTKSGTQQRSATVSVPPRAALSPPLVR